MKFKRTQKLTKQPEDDKPPSYLIAHHDGHHPKINEENMNMNNEGEKESIRHLHALLQSSLDKVIENNNESSQSLWEIATQFFKHPNIDDVSKRETVEKMSLHNLQFQLLKDCDKIRSGSRRKMKNQVKNKDTKWISLTRRGKVPLEVIVNYNSFSDSTSLGTLMSSSLLFALGCCSSLLTTWKAQYASM